MPDGKRAKPRIERSAWPKAALALFLATLFALALFWSESSAWPWAEPELRIWFLDVGQGDATLIESPTGERLLVDGGPDDEVLAKVGQVLPPWDRRIDYVVATHPDADHITGLPHLVERHGVGAVLGNGTTAASYPFEALASTSVPHEDFLAGSTLDLGPVSVRAIWPESEAGRFSGERNERSIVLLVESEGASILLTGDATAEQERLFMSNVGDVDVLKAGHHGSDTSSSLPFLEAARPEVAVISAGEDNRYGHPHPAALDRLEAIGARTLRTDRDGDILLIVRDGGYEIMSKPLPF